MKKVLLLASVGIFSFATFASNEIALNEADFSVYCDGVYKGEVGTIQEAWELCN